MLCVKCDRCGTVVEKQRAYKMAYGQFDGCGDVFGSKVEKYDVCPACFEKIDHFMKMYQERNEGCDDRRSAENVGCDTQALL